MRKTEDTTIKNEFSSSNTSMESLDVKAENQTFKKTCLSDLHHQ
jgi:hypothetical protein